MNKKGFTLIELLIVVAIIGIVAAIAIPNLLVALQKGKQKSSMGELRNVGLAIEAYLTDLAIVPADANITALSTDTGFVPFHIKVVPTNDGWGTLILYEPTAPDIYSLTSWGRNKANGPAPLNPWTVTRLADFNPDLIYSNGMFTQAPVKR